MNLREACEIVDRVKLGYYEPLSLRQAAKACLSHQQLEIHGQWRDGEISLNSRLAQNAVLQDAIESL